MNAMPWYAWVIIALIVVKPLAMPFLIGKERQPYTAFHCFLSIVAAAFYLWAIVELAT